MGRRKRGGGKSWCINTSYVSTLQSVMANRRLPLLGPRRVKVASLTPEKATLPPCHLLCYIVTRKLRFYKRTQRETREPQRAAAFLSQSSLLFFQSASFSRNLVARPANLSRKKKGKSLAIFHTAFYTYIYIYLTVRTLLTLLSSPTDFRNIFRRTRLSETSRGTSFFMLERLRVRRASLPLLIRKALGIPGEAFSVVEYHRRRERVRERREEPLENSGSVCGVNWDSSFCTLISRVASQPYFLPSFAASPYLEGWGKRGGKKVDWQHVARS